MTPEKQIVRVLAAITEGCRTSQDVAEETGLDVKTASAWLSALAADGLIVRSDRRAMCEAGPGRRFNWYLPATP